NNTIRMIVPGDQLSTAVSTVAGNNPPNAAGYADGLAINAQFNNPFGIAADPAGYLYVSDFANRRVRRISPYGIVETVAGLGLIGTSDGDGASATFGAPAFLAVLPTGSLLLADANGSVLRKIERVLNQGSLSGKTR